MTAAPDATSPASQPVMSEANAPIREVVHAWLREDTSLAVKMSITPEACNKLIARLRSAPIPAVQSGAVAWSEGAELDARRSDYDRGWFDREGAAAPKLVAALKHYACSCEPGHCAMSVDGDDTPCDDQLCGRTAQKALNAAPQSEPLPGGVGERERVARIIDPEVFADLAAVQKAGGPWFYGYSGQSRLNAAYAKADAILSAPSGKEQG